MELAEYLRELKMANYSDVKKRKLLIERISDLPPQTQLDAFCDFYGDLPKQGTEEWKRRRRNTIGGSSAAGVLGLNKYSGRNQVARQMLGIGKDCTSIMTTWGNFFEKAMCKFIQIIGGCEVRELGNISGFGRGTATSFSPDGLFIYKSALDEHISTGECPDGAVTLLEIKCPYRRGIRDNIPDYYMPQLYLGMHTIKITEQAMFCEFAIRVCSIRNFNFTSACSSSIQPKISGEPRAIGFVAIIGDTYEAAEPFDIQLEPMLFEGATLFEQFGKLYRSLNCGDMLKLKIFLRAYPQHRREVLEYFRTYVVDFDGIDFGAGNNVFYRHADVDTVIINHKNYSRYYSNLLLDSSLDDFECKIFFEAELDRAREKAQRKGKQVLGVVPFKLMSYRFEIVPKKNYAEEVRELINFYNKVQEIREVNPVYWEAECDKL